MAQSSAKKQNKIIAYFKDVYDELVNKVTWPSWDELFNTSVIVMVASIIIALVILLMDVTFNNLMDLIYSMF